jgi:Ca-activated chloride channel family protein
VTLASPLWLLAAIAAATAILAFWRRADGRRRSDLERFASQHLLLDLTATVSPRRRRAKRALIAAGVLLLGLAFAGPQFGFTWEESQRRGIDVLIALDVSRSMRAQDVAPSRLDRAKLAVTDLVEKLGGDRVGLIAFAGSAFLQCPMTLDHGAFLEALAALQPGVIPAPGSDLASAIRVAEEALRTQARNVKLLVMFSDGEDLGGGALEAARSAAEQGIKVFTVGVGSPAGELVPVAGKDGRVEFLKDPQGQFVKSRLDAETLRKVAETTGAFYEPLGQRGEGVAAVYERALAPLPREELASRMRRVPLDRFQWPLAVALACLALEPLIGERRSRRLQGVLAALLVLGASAAQAASPHEAERLYAAGDYEAALAAYRESAKDAADPKLSFNVGAAAYKSGAYGDAAAAFAEALRADDPALQERSFYNLGNAQFRLGQKTVEQNPQATAQAWQQAIDAYDGALAIDPQDEDARFNREFVRRALEELQREQQQQQSGEPQDGEDEGEPQERGEEASQQEPSEQEQEGRRDEQQAAHDQQQEKQDRSSSGDGDSKDEDEPGKREQAQGDDPKRDERDASGAQPGDQARADGNEPGTRDRDAAGAPPGRMSPAEARDLLDSLQDEATSLPALQASRHKRSRAAQEERDW